ncbi:MAG: hypothetical protein KKD01_20220 [Proteobacteria bacterium]|nr:hypothetical protein [Pseudomonadota bacterium]
MLETRLRNTGSQAGGSGGSGSSAIGDLTGMTEGYVPFGEAGGGGLDQDAGLFWDNTNKRLGVGTASPSGILDINIVNKTIAAGLLSNDDVILSSEDEAISFAGIVASSANAGHRMVFKGTRARGDLDAPTAAANGDYSFSLLGVLYDGATTRATAGIEMVADGTVSSGVAPQKITFATSATSVRVDRLTIKPDGSIQILADNQKLLFGAGQDASIYYNGTDLYINPKEVGTGMVRPLGTVYNYSANALYDGGGIASAYQSDYTTTSSTTGTKFLISGYFQAKANHTITSGDYYTRALQGSAWAQASMNGTMLQLAGLTFNTYNLHGAGDTITDLQTISTSTNHRGAGAVTNQYGWKHAGLKSVDGSGTITNAYGAKIDNSAIVANVTNHYGIWLEPFTGTSVSKGIVLNGDGAGADIVFGAGQDASIYYDGTDLNIKTDEIAPSDLNITCGANKTLELQTAVYKDINVAGVLLSKPTSSAPGTDTFRSTGGTDTTIETYAFAEDEKVHGGFELQHDYKEGTDLTFHVHWQGIDAPTGTDNVQWRLNYIVARDGVTLAAATAFDSPDTAIDTQYRCYRTDFAAITGTTFKIGDQFMFTLTRVAATGDAYAGDALIETAGIHYQVDTLGSRSIATK